MNLRICRSEGQDLEPSARRAGRARIATPAVLGLALLALAGPGLATEGGGGHYPNGAEGFMAGALPPPGTYCLNYLSYYTADEFKDDNGDRLFPKFDLHVAADTLRFVHVTRKQVLGASWALHAFVPLVNVDVGLTPFPGGPSLEDDRLGLGDIIVDPFILGWHSKSWHFIAALDIYLPTGAYDDRDLANPGRNYWTFEPVFAVTYLSDGGFELSGKFMYAFNTENEDTDYRSGQEFHFDYTAAYHTGPWSLGLGGYYYQQTTGDDGRGAVFGDFKGEAIALGPQVKYDHKKMSFTLKYQWETEVENRPEGEAFWFKLLYAF